MNHRIGIVGEYNPDFPPHSASNEAIEHSKQDLEMEVSYDWISTADILGHLDRLMREYQGFWIAPGSPYKNMEAALTLIQYTRLKDIPTLGTCGGFQHMVIEYARNVMNIRDAEHAEYDPYASKLVINHLTCSLAGQDMNIQLLDPDSKAFALYSTKEAKEKYYCNFGLNPEYQDHLHASGFRVVGSDETGGARIIELPTHRFFLATLFVPQNSSQVSKPHPIINGFLQSL